MADGWQLECTEVRQRLAVLLDLKLWSDCWFAVGPRRATRAAHRALLAAASPVFRDFIFGQERDYYDEIDAHETDIDAFDAMLHYIYTDEVHIDSCRGARGLCLAAHRYALPHLRARCAAYLLAHLEPASACDTYEFAEQIDDEQLRDACLQMMRDRTLEVLEADSWVEAREETVARVFALDELSIESELQLLAAAERSARARAPARTEGAEQELRGAVQNIRFLTLAPEEFAKHPTPKALLTDAEILAILTNLATSDAPVPMPSGFSTSRTSRVRRASPRPGPSRAPPSQPPDVAREAELVTKTPEELTADNGSMRTPKQPPTPGCSTPPSASIPPPATSNATRSIMRQGGGTMTINVGPKIPDGFNSGINNKSRTEATVDVIVDLKDFQHHVFHSPTWFIGNLPFRLRAKRYSSDSPTWFIRNLPLQLRAKRYSSDDIFYTLDCNWEDNETSWSCPVKGHVLLLRQSAEEKPPMGINFSGTFGTGSNTFHRGNHVRGALDPASGFLHDNKLLFEVFIKTSAAPKR